MQNDYNFTRENNMRDEILRKLAVIFSANLTREAIMEAPLSKKTIPSFADVYQQCALLAIVSPMIRANKSDAWSLDTGTFAAYIMKAFPKADTHDVQTMRCRIAMYVQYAENQSQDIPFREFHPASKALVTYRQKAREAFKPATPEVDDAWAGLE
jgi:hypothetical protein